MIELKRIRQRCLSELGENEAAACEFKSLVDEYRDAWVRSDGQIKPVRRSFALTVLVRISGDHAGRLATGRRSGRPIDCHGQPTPFGLALRSLAYWRNGQTQLASDAIQQAKTTSMASRSRRRCVVRPNSRRRRTAIICHELVATICQ